MKLIRVVTIVCWIVVAAVLFGLGGWFLSGTIFGISPAWLDRNLPFRVGIGSIEPLTGSFSVASEHTASTENIDSIAIDWVAGDITFTPHDGNTIEITELAQRALHDDERFSVEISGSTLTVRFLDRRIGDRIGRMPQKRLEVRVPHELSGRLSRVDINAVSSHVEVDGMIADGLSISSLYIDTTSGGIALSNLTSRDMEANSTSGRIVINSVAVSEMSLDSTSGAVEVTGARADEISIDTLSGAISVRDTSARMLDLDTTSGSARASGTFEFVNANSLSGAISLENIAVLSVVNAGSTSGAVNLSGAFYSANANTLSGGISIHSIIVPTSLNIGSTSGAVTVTIPNEGSISVSHSSTSGRLNSDIPIIPQNEGAQFVFSTLSGSVNIIELR